MSQALEMPSMVYGTAEVTICSTTAEMGRVAAERAAAILRAAIRERGRARIIIATGNSQIRFMDALVAQSALDWGKVEAFHMDEYVHLSKDHPSSFHYWIRQRFEEKVRPAKMHYINGEAADPAPEVARYSALLAEAPVDLAFVGFGENGHIAFNDPPVADFDDPAMLKVVTLDTASRHQQVGEGHFKDFAAVPEQAITVTCSGLFRAAAWVCAVPEKRKAGAVRNALEGPISTACPASLVRRHPNTYVLLDKDSASLLAHQGGKPVAST